MPGFQRAAQAYQDRVIFLGVDVGQFTGLGSHDDARRLLGELGVRYPAAYAVDDAPLRTYGVVSMPTTVLFDAKGNQAARVDGILIEQQLRDRVQRLLDGPG